MTADVMRPASKRRGDDAVGLSTREHSPPLPPVPPREAIVYLSNHISVRADVCEDGITS